MYTLWFFTFDLNVHEPIVHVTSPSLSLTQNGRPLKSYAPNRTFRRPSKSMLKSSGYQDSFGGFSADERRGARPGLVIHKPNLEPSESVMASATTTGVSRDVSYHHSVSHDVNQHHRRKSCRRSPPLQV